VSRPGWAYRLAIPFALLCTFGFFALLWTTGQRTIAEDIVRFFGVKPAPFPFFDTHAVLAAAECQQRGVDVYVVNPCDAWGRLHVYSPLWLTLIPGAIGTPATPWVGAALDLLVILALPFLLRPRTTNELAIFAAAALSPVMLYALERANNDLVVFLLVLAAALLQTAATRGWRFCSYGVLIGAALLKYYPAVLLVLAGRERRRDAVLIAFVSVAAAALFAYAYAEVLGRALANIPHLPYFTASFSAKNLPFGLAVEMFRLPAIAALVIYAAMCAVALVWLRRAAAALDAADLDWASDDARLAAIGAIVIVGCFFAGQNDYYRCVFFLFTLPALTRWRRQTTPAGSAVHQLLTRLLTAIVFLMWSEFFHRAPIGLFGDRAGFYPAMLFWLLREFVWWWVIAGLGAIALGFVRRLPVLSDRVIATWLGSVGAAARHE
jgi:Glycosyltransferase family 87